MPNDHAAPGTAVTSPALTGESSGASLSLKFAAMPGYARYLLEEKLDEYAKEELRLSRSMEIPLMKLLLSMPDAALQEAISERAAILLRALSLNQASDYIQQSLVSWLSGNTVYISREQVMIEDVVLINLMRRDLFRNFLSGYTNDIKKGMEIMHEMDQFTSDMEKRSIAAIFQMQKQLYNHTQSMAQVGNWQWDLISNKLTWSDEMFRIYDLVPQATFTGNLAFFNHPADQQMIEDYMRQTRESLQPHDFYYRIVLRSGEEKILHAKGQVIADEKGQAVSLFGTVQDVTDTKRSEEAHRRNEHFIYKMMELAPLLISTYNIHTGRYRYVSKSLENILGYAVDEVMAGGTGFFASLIHPDDLDGLMKKNAEAIDQANQSTGTGTAENLTEFVYRLKHRNGSYRWINTFGTVFSRNVQNKVDEVINISIDITEVLQTGELLKQKMQELSGSEERYHKMVSEVEDYAILLLSRDGLIENWNKGAEKIKGYAAKDVIGKHFRIFYTPEDQLQEVPEKLIREAARDGKAGYEGWRVNKNGEKFWGSIILTALYNDDHEVIGFSKVTRDLTERKLAEDKLNAYTRELEKTNENLKATSEALRQTQKILTEDRTRFILEAIPHMVATLGPDGRFSYVNQHLLGYTGLSTEEFQNAGWLNIIHESDRPQLETAWQYALAQLQPMNAEFRLQRNDGIFEWHLGIAKPFFSPLENEFIWVLTFTNIHDQKIIAEKKEEFIGIASHELKTPLTSAKGYLHLAKIMLEQNSPDSSSAIYLKKAGFALERLKNIVAELLDATKLQHGRLQLNMTEFDLGEFVHDITELMETTMARHTITVSGDTQITVRADPDRLEQVLVNLLSNAIKYSPPGTLINIRVWKREEEVTLSVSDEGVGIPAADLPYIFTKFFRVEKDANLSSGMGLGLYIASEIINAHGGRVWVESSLSKGSVFYFSIPA